MSKNNERHFLEGPKSRLEELKFLFSTFAEFIAGFRKLHFVGPCVTVFGSARIKEDNEYYQKAREMGNLLANLGFTVMTGGGPGIMEAANRGAKEAGGMSIGCNIILEHEQQPNPYLDRVVEFDFFFIRKILLSKYSYGFVVFPGGFGTMDEMFEAMTLIQTGKMKRFPIVLFGTSYYANLKEQIDYMAQIGTIDESDLKLFLFTNSMEEAQAHLEKYSIQDFKLIPSKSKRIKPFRWLLEK
jgi:uncharacterized protein (TIGR00730 family)